MTIFNAFTAIPVILCSAVAFTSPPAQDRLGEMDKTVQAFLDRHRGTWRDMNVPESDGRVLHDLIVKHGFTRALEIGTSTGHSGVWIAWALAKTGGKLTTVEIDPGTPPHRGGELQRSGAGAVHRRPARRRTHNRAGAVGTFDFVFSDADKDWYTNYLVAVWPKLAPGGCFTAHNVSGRGAGAGIGDFLTHLKSLPDAVTTSTPPAARGSRSAASGDRAMWVDGSERDTAPLENLRRNPQQLVRVAPDDLLEDGGRVDRFSRLSVSRATHLPAIRAAAGLLLWLTPPPWPSLQPQSLPKRSLS